MADPIISTDILGLNPDAFAGKVVVITGAGRGIGRHAAKLFASMGASVAIAEIDPLTGADTAAEISRSGGSALFCQTDVSDPESVHHLKDLVTNYWGPADILINNAIACPVGTVLEMPIEDWNRALSVNLKGAFLCIRAFLPAMLIGGSGTIINMTSAPSMPHLSAYISSKEGLRALTQSLAGEVGDLGISVVSYGPGMVDTPGGTEVFRQLSTRYGMTYEQFTNSSVNPGYEGLIPVSDAACLLLYLAANARDFHGDNITVDDLLERTGLLNGTGDDTGADTRADDGENTDPNPDAPAVQELWADVLTDLIETEEEFKQLPFFARPMAKSGFKSKALFSLDTWIRKAERFAAGEPIDHRMLSKGEIGRTVEGLMGLARYHREAPIEASRFIKDESVMAEIFAKGLAREERVIALTTRYQGMERP